MECKNYIKNIFVKCIININKYNIINILKIH